MSDAQLLEQSGLNKKIVMSCTSPTSFPNINALIVDGQIIIGKIPPIGNVAIETDVYTDEINTPAASPSKRR